MVSTVVIREQLRRVTRIAYNRIEIHHAVEFFAAENQALTFCRILSFSGV